MKKTLFRFFYFLFIFLFLFNLSIKAEEWQKYPNNPVLSPSSGKWDSLHVSSPAVIYVDDQYKMWYQGEAEDNIWRIGLATSTDGIHWQKYSGNPLIEPSNEANVIETGVVEPTVVKTDIYRMWYNSQNEGVYKIRLATSTDGIHWQKYPGYVLTGQLSWEAKGVANPSVIYKDNRFIMAYTGWGYDSGWRIGLAESSDGINWTKFPTNPLNVPLVNHVGGQSLDYHNNKYHLWYHTGGAMPIDIYHVVSNNLINWSCETSCLIIRSTATGFDDLMSIAPEVIYSADKINLWYAGYKDIWQIGLATNNLFPTEKPLLVIIPGIFASWNKEAILHNQPVSIYDWKLAPFVKEYEGVRNTLKNLGYIENQDFYLFAYDWRKGLNDLAADLNLYLNQLTANHQPPISHFNLVGHSLGGLVGRIYLQKYGTEKINKLITVGSPHQGAPQVYKAIEAGELDRGNNLLWLAQKIILVLNKTGFETDKDTINRLLSVAKDLLPTYNFLKNQNNQEISINNMQIKNETLLSYQNNFPIIFPYLQTIAGEKGNTLMGFKVGPRTILDQLLNLYPDGRPTENFYQIGDFTVTSTSARAGNQPIILNFDHGEIIYKRQAIKEILETLGIDYQENQIVEGEKTDISPSLIFLIRSPAEITVEFNGQIFSEQEGIIFIKNASDGDYTLNVTGKEKGRYTVIIGQIGENNDRWQQIEGEITQSPPSSQTDSYQINFNPQSSQSPVSNPMTLFDEIILYLTDLNKTLKKTEVNRAISNLHQAKQYHQQNNKGRTKSILLLAHKQIFQAEVKSNDTDKRKLLYAIEKLENLYENALLNYRFGLSTWRLKGNLTRYKKIIGPTERYLLSQKQRGKNVVKNSNILLEIEKRVNLAEKSLNKNNLNLADILLKSVEQLIKEVRKL